MAPKAPKVKTSPLEQATADIARRQDTRAQTMESEYLDPIRGIVTPQILEALGQNPFQTSLSAANRGTLESQYGQARNAAMNTGARGGMLRSMMTGLERDRAQSISQAVSQARELGIGRALQFAGGAVPTAAGTSGMEGQAMTGLMGANQSASQRAMAQAQAQQQSASGYGALAGGALSFLPKPS